jgi:hypothetical protein
MVGGVFNGGSAGASRISDLLNLGQSPLTDRQPTGQSVITLQLLGLTNMWIQQLPNCTQPEKSNLRVTI